MSRLNDANVALAKEIIARYPRPKSALIPLLHLSQEQNGYITREAMAHLGELVGVTSAEVYGTATFYEMFRFEPVGKYLVNICGTLSCALMGAHDLMHRAEESSGSKPEQRRVMECSPSHTQSVRPPAPRLRVCR